MKYGDKQHKLLKQLLVINPKMTVGQAAHRLNILNKWLDQRDQKCA